MLWVPGQFSQHFLVLGRLAQSRHLLMPVFLPQAGTSYLFLMAPHPPILRGCVLAEIHRSWATGPLFLALPYQGSEYDIHLMSFILDLIHSGIWHRQCTLLRTIGTI
jgi:hypothetical protein